jgi:predicted transcriptional regulator/transcriptional regulator with XRE-family HTH domain
MLGNRVRRLRHQQGLTQVAMAAQLGISPSYLNLIEHNQRGLNRPLLLKLSECFDIDLHAFSGNQEARLLADLTELFGDPLFGDLEFEPAELSELVGGAPAACQALLILYRAYRNAQEDIRGLSSRLAEDPYLAASSHQLLTLLTSVRSFAEILQDNVDLAARKRQQFVGILVKESQKLTDLVNQLFGFLTGEGLQDLRGADSPADEVTEILHAQHNHFPELEDAAEEMRATLDLRVAGALDVLSKALAERHGPNGAAGSNQAGTQTAAGLDGKQVRPELTEILPPERAAFDMARQIGLASLGPLFETRLAAAQLSTEAARGMYRRALTNYFAAALLMPYQEFLETARNLRHDIELLGRRFGVGFEQVCHRLATLHRPGAEGVPFHFLRIDIAGNLSKRFSGSGLRIPRFGGVCPRWNVHEAFMKPGQIDRQLASLPDGTTYLCIAKTLSKPGAGFREPSSHYAIGIGCEVSFAPQLVYADGLDLGNPEVAVPVGVHCRLCERRDCRQRAFPSLSDPAVRQGAAK